MKTVSIFRYLKIFGLFVVLLVLGQNCGSGFSSRSLSLQENSSSSAQADNSNSPLESPDETPDASDNPVNSSENDPPIFSWSPWSAWTAGTCNSQCQVSKSRNRICLSRGVAVGSDKCTGTAEERVEDLCYHGVDSCDDRVLSENSQSINAILKDRIGSFGIYDFQVTPSGKKAIFTFNRPSVGGGFVEIDLQSINPKNVQIYYYRGNEAHFYFNAWEFLINNELTEIYSPSYDKTLRLEKANGEFRLAADQILFQKGEYRNLLVQSSLNFLNRKKDFQSYLFFRDGGGAKASNQYQTFNWNVGQQTWQASSPPVMQPFNFDVTLFTGTAVSSNQELFFHSYYSLIPKNNSLVVGSFQGGEIKISAEMQSLVSERSHIVGLTSNPDSNELYIVQRYGLSYEIHTFNLTTTEFLRKVSVDTSRALERYTKSPLTDSVRINPNNSEEIYLLWNFRLYKINTHTGQSLFLAL